MKPFNLERAIAGDPVCTRDGRDVVWGAYNPAAEPDMQIVAWVGKCPICYYANGEYETGGKNSTDLFMRPVKKKVWLVRIPVTNQESCLWKSFDNKYAAEREAPVGHPPQEIEIEI